MHDELGNRIKDQYEDRTRFSLPRRTYTIIRIDGKAFHTFTKGFKKPFDKALMEVMDNTAIELCRSIQGAKFAYVQSDEISILLTDFETPQTDAWFDGNVQKIVSVSASIATAAFNNGVYLHEDILLSMDKKAMFDSRVFTIPDAVEVENYFIWRQQDASRNSVQMVARSLYSHKECNNKNNSELQEMIFAKGQNWNDLTAGEKRGRLIVKEKFIYLAPNKGHLAKGTFTECERTRWVAQGAPMFTQDRSVLRSIIPVQETFKDKESL